MSRPSHVAPKLLRAVQHTKPLTPAHTCARRRGLGVGMGLGVWQRGQNGRANSKAPSTGLQEVGGAGGKGAGGKGALPAPSPAAHRMKGVVREGVCEGGHVGGDESKQGRDFVKLGGQRGQHGHAVNGSLHR